MAVGRELTKLHEELWRGTLGGGRRRGLPPAQPRGEWVLVVGPGAGRGWPSGRRRPDRWPPCETAWPRAPTAARRWPRWPPTCSLSQAAGLPAGLCRLRRRPAQLNDSRSSAGTLRRGPVLRHHADLLRQRRAPHRPRLHDGHRRRPGPLAPPARRRRLLPHRHRRARAQGAAGRRGQRPHAEEQADRTSGASARPGPRSTSPTTTSSAPPSPATTRPPRP